MTLESRRKTCRALVTLLVALGKHNEAEQLINSHAGDFPSDDPWLQQAAEDLRYRANDAIEVAPDLYEVIIE